MKKLSIITINYNNLHGLIRTIEFVVCLSAHLRSQIEYIIVDGLSTDGSVNYIEEHKSALDKIIIESDHGIYDAINKGINIASADYILALNSGDVLRSDFLNLIFTEIQDKDIYYCDVDIISNGKRTPHISDHKKLSHRMGISHQGAVVARKLYKHRLYDQSYKLSGDFEFFNYCFVNNYEFEKINYVISEFEAGGRSDNLFLISRFENLRALYNNQQYWYMLVGLIRYIREAVHLWVSKVAR